MEYKGLSQKWNERFAFFDANGLPNTATYKAAFKALPFMQRIKIQSNFIAFFFGWIYFFVLGLWRKNLAMLGLIFVFSIVTAILPINSSIVQGLGFVFGLLYSFTANHAYYLHIKYNSKSWNPFEGMF